MCSSFFRECSSNCSSRCTFVGKIPKTPPLITLQTPRKEVTLKIEQLQPLLHVTELEKRLKDLRYVLHLIKRKNENAPSGHLKIAVKKNRIEYYYIKDRGSSRGSYIPKADISFAAQLAQKDYNHKLLPLITKETRCLESFLKATSSLTELQNLYQSFCPARRELIKPLTLTDDQYITQWQEIIWQGSGLRTKMALLLFTRTFSASTCAPAKKSTGNILA